MAVMVGEAGCCELQFNVVGGRMQGPGLLNAPEMVGEWLENGKIGVVGPQRHKWNPCSLNVM